MRRRRGTGQKVQLGRPGCLANGLQSVKLLRCKRGNYRANGEDHLACSASCSFPMSLSGGLGGRDRSGAQLPGRGRSAGRCPRTASGFFYRETPLFRPSFRGPGHCCTRPLCKAQTRLATSSWHWTGTPALHRPFSGPAAHRLPGLVAARVKESMNCRGLRGLATHRTGASCAAMPECRARCHEVSRQAQRPGRNKRYEREHGGLPKSA